MDSEFYKPRCYKSLSSSETVSNITPINSKDIKNSDELKEEDIYVQLVESFKNLLSETYSALF